MKFKSFEDLDIWKISIDLAKDTYLLTSKAPFRSDFGLKDQIQRSVVSISSNIVEGFEKNNNNEFIRFLKIAKGSLGEARSQLRIAYEIHYIAKPEFDSFNEKLVSLGYQIGGFVRYLEEHRPT